MSKIKTVIIDDEFPAIKMMESFVTKTDFLELAGQFSNSTEAYEFIKNNKLDLVLTDIKMPGINGVVLASLIPKDTVCIFLSASPEFAIQAYEADVVDYILKPYSYERFLKAINKAKDYLQLKHTDDFITVKSDYMTHKIPISQIKWVEGFSEYIKIITPEKNHAVLMRLSNFEEQYKSLGFIRIHRSYIVHKKTILSYSSDKVKLVSGQELPIGRTYRGNMELI